MCEIMLDLETMATTPNAAIVSIGAVIFSPHEDSEDILGSEFYRKIDLRSSSESGGEIDPETVTWWLNQSKDAQSQTFDGLVGNRRIYNHSEVLRQFSDWLSIVAPDEKDRAVWGNGVAMDNVILGNAYKRIGMSQPWSFRGDRCYRTMKSLYPDVKMDPRIGTYHNALDDAKNQALHLAKIFKSMKGN